MPHSQQNVNLASGREFRRIGPELTLSATVHYALTAAHHIDDARHFDQCSWALGYRILVLCP